MNPSEVVYETHPDAPGQYFRCARYGLMNTDACSRNFGAAQELKNKERLAGCLGCQTGRLHSGKAIPKKIESLPASTCVRCRRDPINESQYRDTRQGRIRMVCKGVLCVSCFNREREVILGKNSRGTKPRLQLKPLVVDYSVDGATTQLKIPRATGTEEAFARADRLTKGREQYLMIAGTATVVSSEPGTPSSIESK
jgi:hypothetical protein